MKRKIKELLCVICGDERPYGRLHLHVISKHNISSKEYTIKYLHNGIEPVCKCGCGYKTRYVQFSFKEFHKGHNANRKGIKLPEEQIQKMSEIKKKWAKDNPELLNGLMLNARKFAYTDEALEKRSDSMIKMYEDNPQLIEDKRATMDQRYIDHPELRQQTSDRMKHWHANLTQEEKDEIWDSDWKDKISQSITDKYLDGGFEWSRGTYFSTKMKESFYYRSSWELKYMKQLDQDNLIVSWIYEPFWISYVKNGDKHRHIPDFVIEYSDGHKEIHEVGVKKLKEEKFAEKVAAIKEYCGKNDYQFRIVEF
ncbi:MAG: hypothetical protein Q8Q92_03500 [bacterium]|nr:hypothetical protein [bacterium]